MKWITTGFSLIVALISLGCGASNQLATLAISDAQAQVDGAKEVGAENLAAEELTDAEQMLARAEAALSDGKKETYRLGMRAYLKARVAQEIAIAKSMEMQAHTLEQELALKNQATEAARRKFEAAERELVQLKLIPKN